MISPHEILAHSRESGVLGLGASIAFVIGIISLLWLRTGRKSKGPFPPGPPRLPLLGNLHQLPATKSYLQFTEWRKQYGDLIGIKAGPLNMIVLNSPDLFQKVFVTRGSIYSDRPNQHVLRNFIFPGEDHMALVHYDATHRLLRTTIKQYLTSPANLQDALPMQDRMADKLITRLRDISGKQEQGGESALDLDALDRAVRRCIGLWSFEISMVGVLGPVGLHEQLKDYDVQQEEHTESTNGDSKNNEPSELYYEQWHYLQRAVLVAAEAGVSQLYDMLPAWVLQLISPLWSRMRLGEKHARTLGVTLREMHRDLLARLKAAIALAESTRGELAYEGMMAKILRSQAAGDVGASPITEAQIKTLSQTLMDAAADTTSTTLSSCLLALVTNPETLRRAQKEVDEVCGSKMPTGEDIERFPYLMACICEAQRWRPPVPILVPHRLEKDDNLEGYHIPKGTTVIVNMWGITHDPQLFEDPDQFQPERFLDGQAQGSSSMEVNSSLPSFPFGAGRRMCPGDRFALNSLMVGLPKILWAFDLVLTDPKPDLNIETAFTGGIAAAPNKLPIKFVWRRG